jgi:hypothetical protein
MKRGISAHTGFILFTPDQRHFIDLASPAKTSEISLELLPFSVMPCSLFFRPLIIRERLVLNLPRKSEEWHADRDSKHPDQTCDSQSDMIRRIPWQRRVMLDSIILVF